MALRNKPKETAHSVMEFHTKQGEAFLSDAKVTLCSAGIQSGKTTVGTAWMVRQMSRFKGDGNAFIIAAPTYKILNQSTMPTFLRIMEGRGSYEKARQEYRLRSGGVIYIRTSTDPDSIEGIQNVRAAWLDEAGKCKYQFWVNLEGRCARTNGLIMCTTTPYARNWPYTEIIRPASRKERDDALVLTWSSIANPTFPKEHYERQRTLLDPVRFAMKYEGEHARRVGLVFDLPDHQVVEPFEIGREAKYYAGVDWGFSDPFVVVVRAIMPDGTDIQVKEFYQRGFYPDDIPEFLLQLQRNYDIQLFVADPSDPGKIASCQRRGVKIQGADNDIRRGIDAHIKAIRAGKYIVFNTCKHTLDEYETYHWPDEEDEGVDAEDTPVDEENHCMDATRYLSLYLDMRGVYDKIKLRVIDSEAQKTETLQYTHKPAWERKPQNEKRYEEL